MLLNVRRGRSFSLHESRGEIEKLQDLLDRSYRDAGKHLRSIHTKDRRVRTPQLVERLQGMCLLVLATVSSRGRPLSAPVDGVFHRGHFYFGTDPSSVRWAHLQGNPAVSATHLPSEDFAVTVHGRAVRVDVSESDPDGLRVTLLEAYTPRYGPQWQRFLDSGPTYARIEADRLSAIDVAAGPSEYSQALAKDPRA